MSINVEQTGELAFEKDTINVWLKTLRFQDREFVSNTKDGLVYHSGDVTITMHGYFAAEYGKQPTGWDLNNSQIRQIEFDDGKNSFEIDGFAMNLRETFVARSLESFRDWTVRASYGDYQIHGTAKADVIHGVDVGKSYITGGAGGDKLYSLGIWDRIFGGGGDDTIIVKNDGKAQISGGSGSDTFVFKSVADQNLIRDFKHGQDTLDLRQSLDSFAKSNHFDSDEISFVGDGKFTGHGLEVGFDQHSDGGKSVTTIEISAAGEVTSLIDLLGHIDLSKSDFLL